jgi:hypothetical protein
MLFAPLALLTRIAMKPISPAPNLPYTPGAPLKYRRADIAPAEGVQDVEGGATQMDNDDSSILPSTVPLPFTGQLVDKWV